MRATVVFVTALLVVGAGAPFAAASPSTAADAAAASGTVDVQDDEATNESENETAPGARLMGVAEVQGAEVEGEVEKRSFGLQVAAANSNASKASVVAQQTQNLESRLAELRDRRAELEAALENGTISESRYRAEIAGLAARISTLRELTNATSETAKGLPAEALAERGVNATAIERLRTSAANLSGPEVAEIARSIAGPPNGTVGPPANAGGGPPDDVPAGDNSTTGPPTDAPTGENSTNGPPDDTPGDDQDAGQNATDGAPENASDGVGDDVPANDTMMNGTDVPGNDTDVPIDDNTTTVSAAVTGAEWSAVTADLL